ncbi:MAG: ferritin family protein [Ignavibacteria bacterium]
MISPDLTALEALEISIRTEIDSQELYKDIADQCKNEFLRERFLNLMNEEKKHQSILIKMHKELFKEVELKIPPSQISRDEILAKLYKPENIADVIKFAIEKERKSREFYLDAAEIVLDQSGKRMFRYLADVEFTHQIILNAELEMIEKYPAYFNHPIDYAIEQSFQKRKK